MNLHLNPALPEQWQQLSFPLFWQAAVTGRF
ncbi:glycosyl hydrolase family 65 protein [Shigella flexneri]